jgi:Tfp pilus assembly protein PilN
MRELEFLPSWYPQARRQRRMVILQSWVTIGLVAGLGLWMFLAQRNVRSHEGSLDLLSREIEQTRLELRKLDEQLSMQKQLREQDRINTELGAHVETTRLLNVIESTMPREMAIQEFDLDIQTTDIRPSGLGRARAERDKEKTAAARQRRLKARLLGVVPTDVDLANFLAGLSAVPFFDQVAMTYAKDRTAHGHLMREFEVTLGIELSAAPTD